MFSGGIPIGKAFGISLRLNYSWFIVFVLVTWALTIGYFPSAYPHWSLVISILAGVITSLLFFASVLAHELMHSVVAQAAGIPVHSITLFIFGGVSELAEEPKRPVDEFRIALAGPLTSLVMGGIFWGLWFCLRNTNEFVTAVAFWLGWINVVLAAFNLIPGFPLDGGRVLRSILWWRSQNLRSATKTASTIGRAVGYLFIFGGIFIIFRGDWINGVWLAFIGWFLENAAAGSYRQLAVQDILKGHVVAEAMVRDCTMVSPELTLERLVSEHIFSSGRRCFPVAQGSHVLGMITLHDIKAVTREQWGRKTVQEAMTPLSKIRSVKPEEDLSAALRLLAEQNVNQLPVIKDGDIVGMISRENVISFINVLGELSR